MSNRVDGKKETQKLIYTNCFAAQRSAVVYP